MNGSVKHQAKPKSSIKRDSSNAGQNAGQACLGSGQAAGENFPYVFKGAQGAPRIVRRVIPARGNVPWRAKRRTAGSAGGVQASAGTLTGQGQAAGQAGAAGRSDGR